MSSSRPMEGRLTMAEEVRDAVARRGVVDPERPVAHRLPHHHIVGPVAIGRWR